MKISTNMVEWLANGERGISSNTMFTTLTGVNTDTHSMWGNSHPRDPADFRRCLLLLDRCPELKLLIHEMSRVSPTWKRLVEHWDEITATFESEVPQWRTIRGWEAPWTFQLMQTIIYPKDDVK